MFDCFTCCEFHLACVRNTRRCCPAECVFVLSCLQWCCCCSLFFARSMHWPHVGQRCSSCRGSSDVPPDMCQRPAWAPAVPAPLHYFVECRQLGPAFDEHCIPDRQTTRPVAICASMHSCRPVCGVNTRIRAHAAVPIAAYPIPCLPPVPHESLQEGLRCNERTGQGQNIVHARRWSWGCGMRHASCCITCITVGPASERARTLCQRTQLVCGRTDCHFVQHASPATGGSRK